MKWIIYENLTHKTLSNPNGQARDICCEFLEEKYGEISSVLYPEMYC